MNVQQIRKEIDRLFANGNDLESIRQSMAAIAEHAGNYVAVIDGLDDDGPNVLDFDSADFDFDEPDLMGNNWGSRMRRSKRA